ncbi:MAG: DNA polymerase III subunit alpha [Myxococcota bacterium]|nr:DNA polymerase III subunit alpha [Myxococcota bacterium]
MAFAHLHVHSQFSLLDGAIPIKQLAPAVAALGQEAVALTDHCNLYGAVTFDKTCKSAGVKPVFGAGIWVDPLGLAHRPTSAKDAGYHLLCLVENEQGYLNLCNLITTAIFDGMHYKPRVDLEGLRAHSEGLIALTSGSRGPIRSPFLSGREEKAAELMEPLVGIFDSDHLYVELQDVGLPRDVEANEFSRSVASAFSLDTVVTNTVHYLRPEDAPTLDLLQCIGKGQSLNHPDRPRSPTDQLYLKSEEEIRELFPQDADAVGRTVEIAERCNYRFTYDTYYFPASNPPDEGQDTEDNWTFFYEAFPPPAVFGLPTVEEGPPPHPPGGGTLDGYFEWYSRVGLEQRLLGVPEEEHPVYWERFDEEIGTVNSMGFGAYFLIVAEFINWAKDQGIPVGPGRGSAAGSLVAWGLRITNIDPIRFGLLFERFLNKERVSMPDIDIDFCQDRREEVIEHTRRKYGKEFVAQIITYGNLKAKLAVRDVARVLDLNFNEADRIAKLIPDELGIKLEKAAREEALVSLMDVDPRVRRIMALAQRIEGLTRQTGVHAAGVVVADRPLVELSPLYRDGPEGGPVVQYDMKSAESIGLIKFDFLGLKTLDQIRDAVELIERNTGEVIDVDALPESDPAVAEMLSRGDSLGVFQVESSGMRELLCKLKPQGLHDMVPLVALYRPGPLNSGMVDDFVECRHGRQKVAYLHPDLKDVLQETYGVVLYQEQVMKVAQVLANYSLGEADILRRAMGKKIKEEMVPQKERFVSGATERGVEREQSEKIFDLLAKFADYGFNKSHSAAYGLVAYQTAWLKANHRSEYMAALMSIESNNTDKLVLYTGDCRRAGIDILAPCLNQSMKGFDVPSGQKSIRFGLAAVKNVGEGAVEAIMDARAEAGGSFSDLADCLERLDFNRVNKRVLENLVKAGAFDWVGATRCSLSMGMEDAVASAQRKQADARAGQASLFGGSNNSAALVGFKLPDTPEWPMAQNLAMEKDALGFFLSGHPVEAFAEEVDRHATCPLIGLMGLGDGKEVSVAGMASEVRKVTTKKGGRMAFVRLDDGQASVDCIFFPDPWAASRAVLEGDRPFLLKGKLERKGEDAKIIANSVELLSEIRERRTREVHICISQDELDSERIAGLRDLLRSRPGTCEARLTLLCGTASEVVLKLGGEFKVSADDELTEGLNRLFRRPDVVSFR